MTVHYFCIANVFELKTVRTQVIKFTEKAYLKMHTQSLWLQGNALADYNDPVLHIRYRQKFHFNLYVLYFI